MIGQKIAVVKTLLTELKESGIDYKLNGEIPISEVLTKEIKSKVQMILCEGFHNGLIQMSESASKKYVGNEVKMKGYVSGLLNNWIRKNPEFNNGIGYTPKNPGSRTGQTDESIKNLRLMKKSITDEKVLAEIDQAIADRLAEIKPESVVKVNAEAIPEHLRHLVK